MAFDPSKLVGTPRPWFQTRVNYEGSARAEFTNPPGTIEGPSIVSINSAGRSRVRIKVEKIDAPDVKNFALGSGSVPLGTFLVNGLSNPCRSLIVETDSGVFTAGDRIVHDGFPFGIQKEVDLRPLQSRFEVKGAAPAKYWVLPLVNFLPEPWEGEFIPQLADHPLRLNSWPAVPDELADHEKWMVSWHLRQHAALYYFDLNGTLGFIERMPNFKARAKRVHRKRSRLITAVMVGPAHLQNVDFSDYASLFPLDVLGKLSLATGVHVGAPWIEFRDGNGALVRRVHCFGAGRFERTHAAIPKHLVSNGLGYLAGKVLTTADRGQKYLRAAVSHALGAADQRASLECQFISVCRGFETLCRQHGFIKQNLSLRLGPAQQTDVKGILQEAATKIRKMQRADTDPDRKAVLETIGSRAQNAGQTEKSFGLAVADLAQKFGFHDAAVLDAYFAAHPHPTGMTTWPGVLTYYRAAATHDAYFDWVKPEDLYTILRVRNHLHDLLLRVLFKTVGYDGPYQPPIPPLMQRDSVDWVKPTTRADLLGYA